MSTVARAEGCNAMGRTVPNFSKTGKEGERKGDISVLGKRRGGKTHIPRNDVETTLWCALAPGGTSSESL